MPAEQVPTGAMIDELGRITSELAAQRRLSATVVHDLAGPAQVILGMSEMILEGEEVEPDLRRRIEQIHRSASTIATMLGDLRMGTPLEDKKQLALSRLDMVELVASLAVRSQVLADSKNMTVEIAHDVVSDDDPRRSCHVVGDLVKIERVLTNLIGNAVKFSPRGSVVALLLERDGDVVRIGVRDDGPGVPRAQQASIFEAYQRGDDTRSVPGLGLGLHIAQQIVTAHGGSISVASTRGRGATFWVELPLALDDRAASATAVPLPRSGDHL